MKALLYKDVRILMHQSWLLLGLVMLFVIMSAALPDFSIFLAYAPLVLTSLAVSTLSYDERSGWLSYADTMPYGRGMVVLEKYVLALLGCFAATVLTVCIHLAFGIARGDFQIVELLFQMVVILATGLLYGAILLPLHFKFGAEKSNIVYILVLVVMMIAVNWIPMPGIVLMDLGIIALLIFLAAVGILSASYFLSVRIYRKRGL